MQSRPQSYALAQSHALGQQMIKAMITKINDQTNDHITNDQTMIISQQHSACHITKLGIYR